MKQACYCAREPGLGEPCNCFCFSISEYGTRPSLAKEILFYGLLSRHTDHLLHCSWFHVRYIKTDSEHVSINTGLAIMRVFKLSSKFFRAPWSCLRSQGPLCRGWGLSGRGPPGRHSPRALLGLKNPTSAFCMY